MQLSISIAIAANMVASSTIVFRTMAISVVIDVTMIIRP